ncbi:hydrolase [Halioglobus maricola]|uniref:Hydrolase n=2 Tax=Halioglobus maricola TaxID=2601894 RepID=A0A5P9NQV3_9GAMM|nr:hydrolase [Halioglobus maricola]
MADKIRVAVAQFHAGADIDQNLASCLHWLDRASECQPDLIVLPEFCNHLSWYDNKQHCFDVSVALDSPFLAAIADKAKQLAVHVVVNCTVQREGGVATGSSLLYSPTGELLADNTKQIYIGHENDFLERATTEGPVVETALGRAGLYACMDGVINETPRCLALNGAQMILNSLNSFATDEASLHIPVRAAENKIYVIAANKVGPLVPEVMVEGISAATGIPPRFLSGAGESQIVAPDGTVLAMASLDQEEYVYADIEPSLATDKCRPDGTDVFASRRPELYAPIAQDPADQPLPPMEGAAEIAGAVITLADASDLDEAAAAIARAVAKGAQLIALPPMVPVVADPAASAAYGDTVLARIADCCSDAIVTTAIVLPAGEGYQYCAVAVDKTGLLQRQGQVHHSERFAWSELADRFEPLETPFGRLALVPSDDSIYPETFRLLAIAGVEVAVVPLAPLEDWELATGLLERSAENRINLLVAVDTVQHGPAFCTELQTDFTVMTEWQEREFDGLLSQPIWHRAASAPGELYATLRPVNAAHKVVSQNTDLLAGRPWDLATAIVS